MSIECGDLVGQEMKSAMVGQRRLSIANHRAAPFSFKVSQGMTSLDGADDDVSHGLRTKWGTAVVILSTRIIG